MLYPLEARRISLSQNPPASFAIIMFVFALLCAGKLNAQTVAAYDFEDGTADGWTSFNGATTPVATTAAAFSGSHSLLTTTNSTGASSGPSINLGGVLQAGAKYTITGYVQLTSGESATNANFTIKRSDPSCSGGTCYDTIGSYRWPCRIQDGRRSAEATQSAQRRPD